MHQPVAKFSCAFEVTDVDFEKSFERVKWPLGLMLILIVEIEMMPEQRKQILRTR